MPVHLTSEISDVVEEDELIQEYGRVRHESRFFNAYKIIRNRWVRDWFKTVTVLQTDEV